MKFFALIFVIFAVVSATLALKNAECGEESAKNGNGIVACLADIPSWSYNSSSNECIKFTYGGCGGNKNRFSSQAECENMCKE